MLFMRKNSGFTPLEIYTALKWMKKNILSYILIIRRLFRFASLTGFTPSPKFGLFLTPPRLSWRDRACEAFRMFLLYRRKPVRLSKFGAGFTLLEIVILVGILSMITLATLIFQQDFFKVNRLVEGSLGRETEVRRLLKSFAEELRSAVPSSAGGYLIEQAADSSFVFFVNIDSDDLKERIHYFLSGSTLQKGVLKPGGLPLTYNPANEVIQDLVKDVTPAAIFSYYDSTFDGTGSPLTQPVDLAKIRLVKVTITVDSNGPKPPEPISVSTQATIRGLRFK